MSVEQFHTRLPVYSPLVHQGGSQWVSAHTRRARGAAGRAPHRAQLCTDTARCLCSGQGALPWHRHANSRTSPTGCTAAANDAVVVCRQTKDGLHLNCGRFEWNF